MNLCRRINLSTDPTNSMAVGSIGVRWISKTPKWATAKSSVGLANSCHAGTTKDNIEAKQIKAEALTKLARNMVNATARNYYLTVARELREEIKAE